MVRPWTAVKPPADDEKLAKLKEIAQTFGVKFDAEAGRGGGRLTCTPVPFPRKCQPPQRCLCPSTTRVVPAEYLNAPPQRERACNLELATSLQLRHWYQKGI